MPAKPRVLMLTPWLPRPYDAGSRRITTACKYLGDRYAFVLATISRIEDGEGSVRQAAAGMWWLARQHGGIFEKVHFVQASKDPEEPRPGGPWLPEDVRRYYCAGMRERLERIVAEEKIDLVHIEYDLMSPYVEDLRRLGRRPVLLTHHDMGSVSLFQSYFREMTGFKRLLRLGAWWRRLLFTRRLFKAFDGLIVLTQADRKRLARLVSAERIHVVPTGVDLERFASASPRSARAEETLVYVGHYPHYPNEDAVVWFARDVLPLIRRRRPNVRFQVVGSDPTAAVRALAADPGIEVTGTVDDVRPYEAAATVVVAPLRLGQGIKGKVLEAFAAGTPVVATSCANEGIGAVPEREILLGDSPERFAAQVLRLMDDRELWERLSQAGRALVERGHSWRARAEQLDRVYRETLAHFAP